MRKITKDLIARSLTTYLSSLASPWTQIGSRLESPQRIGSYRHTLYVVTDLDSPFAEVCHRYDLRGGVEIDIRDDKQGLLLTHRRKRRWEAQETLVLLNDLAHNFLSMFRSQVLQGTPLAAYGPYRLIQEVLSIPGEVRIDQDHLVEVCLQETHPWAPVLVEMLPRLWR